ncbi:MAG: response regulator [Lachnospiraceae bacterium]|nr:response regulator [Lachnospiraceae bacterium]
METLLHISFSLAAFVFSVVLYILVCALDDGQSHKNLKFKTLTVTIVIGNFISILDNIFRDSGIFPTPVWIKLLLLLLVYLANILLTYYMALYMESFFREFKYKKLFFKINTGLMISGIILTAAFYAGQFIFYRGEDVVLMVPLAARVILGYVYELYYLIYAITLFIIFSKEVSGRARMTSVAAFVVVIGSVLFELLNTFGVGSGILYNYFGAVLGLYIFYIGVETPDYRNLLQTLNDLDTAKQAADEANRSKSDFLANMSHEIRTPINAVLGMNEMISREAEDDTILTYSENIENAGRTLLGLINDILDFSKIEVGKIEIIPVDYDLSSCINDLVNMISDRAEKKGLILNLDFDRKMPRFLRGDEVRVKQVITNILTNAVKYTEKGSVLFSIGFEKTEEPDSVILKVSVKDTGIGIKPEDIPKLFSEFERIEEKRNRNIEGTGLGMSITKRLLELMGSSLIVESEYGVGSTFSFALKQKVTSWHELGDYEVSYHDHQNTHKKYREKFTAPDAKVLVVDDNPMNLMVFKSLIKKTRVKVDTADSGYEGIKRASEEKYDVIFLDHMMPEKDGIETLHELKKDKDGPNRKTPSICLTANAISGAREQYIDEGFEDYLTKPINYEELENLLLSYIPEEKVQESADKEDAAENDTRLLPELSSLSDAGIDVDKGMENAGDTGSYIALLRTFHDTADERLEELGSFYNDGNIDEFTIRVHALKSSLRIIGAAELGDRAEELEYAGMSKDTEIIRLNHGSFIAGCTELKEALSPVIKKIDAENDAKKGDQPEAGKEYLNKVYGEMEEAADDFDTEQLDTIFNIMEEYSIPDDEKSLWNEIRNAYEQLDYTAIADLIRQRKGE